MLFVKRTLPLIITFITGIIMIVAYFTGSAFPGLKSLGNIFQTWIQVIMSFTMLLGAVSLLRINLSKISRKSEGWGYSLVLVIGFLVMVFLGFISGSWPMFEKTFTPGQTYNLFETSGSIHEVVTIVSDKTDAGGKETVMVKTKSGKIVRANPNRLRGSFMTFAFCFNSLLFNGVFKAAQATMFSLLAFFVASASFRAFRIKSKEAALLMGSAFIVMLGNVPVGAIISRWLAFIPYIGPHIDFTAMKEWIMSYPSSAAQSSILIGAMLGYISASMKIILGVERSYLGGEG